MRAPHRPAEAAAVISRGRAARNRLLVRPRSAADDGRTKPCLQVLEFGFVLLQRCQSGGAGVVAESWFMARDNPAQAVCQRRQRAAFTVSSPCRVRRL